MSVDASAFVGVGWILEYEKDFEDYQTLLGLLDPSDEDWESVDNPEEYFSVKRIGSKEYYTEDVITIINGYVNHSNIFLGKSLWIGNMPCADVANLILSAEETAKEIYRAFLEKEPEKLPQVRQFTYWD